MADTRGTPGDATDDSSNAPAPHPGLAPVVESVGEELVLGPVWKVWLVPVLVAALAITLVLPLDGAIHALVQGVRLPGDVRRELHAWQQYGAATSLAFAAAVIALLDPLRARRLLDLGVACALVGAVVTGLKMFVGRPRPALEDPGTILGPFGVYPIPVDGRWVLAHAWDTGLVRSAELWSMPSSHTAFAVVLSVFLVGLYPRLLPVAAAMVVLVGTSRVLFDAHWASDVLIGAAVAYALAQPAVARYWGVRLMDWLWRRLVDRDARPALAWVLADEAARRRARHARGPGAPEAENP